MILDPLQYLRAIAADSDRKDSESSSVTWAQILLVSLQVAMERSIDGSDSPSDYDLLLRKLHDELDGALQRAQQDSCPPSLSDKDLVEAVRELAVYETGRPSLSEPQDRFLRWLSDSPANLDDWTKSTWLQLLNAHHVKAAYFEERKTSSASLSDDAKREIGDKLNPPSDRRTKSPVRLQHWFPTIIVVAVFFPAAITFAWWNGKQIKESADNAMMAAVSELKIALGELDEVPIGGITMFYGKANELPENWRIARGQLVNDPDSSYHGQQLPDLRHRFIRGAFRDSEIGNQGGRDQRNTHRHTVNAGYWTASRLLCLGNEDRKSVV